MNVFVMWTKHGTRSETLAKKLNLKLIKIGRGFGIDDYAIKIIKTLFRLKRERPEVVFVQFTSPIISGTTWLYSKVAHCKHYVLDGHTGSVYGRFEKAFKPLNKLIINNSDLLILHNEGLYNYVKNDYKVDFMVMEDIIPDWKPSNKDDGYIVYICTFSDDEPVEELIKATILLPNHKFKITGDHKKETIGNVEFTGYMDDEKYIETLKNSNMIIVLTNQKYTLLCGSYEAVALEKPLIVSGSETLRGYFKDNVVYTANCSNEIKEAILTMDINYNVYKNKIKKFKKEKIKENNLNLSILRRKLGL